MTSSGSLSTGPEPGVLFVSPPLFTGRRPIEIFHFRYAKRLSDIHPLLSCSLQFLFGPDLALVPSLSARRPPTFIWWIDPLFRRPGMWTAGGEGARETNGTCVGTVRRWVREDSGTRDLNKHPPPSSGGPRFLPFRLDVSHLPTPWPDECAEGEVVLPLHPKPPLEIRQVGVSCVHYLRRVLSFFLLVSSSFFVIKKSVQSLGFSFFVFVFPIDAFYK